MTTFHVRHDCTPQLARETLTLLAQHTIADEATLRTLALNVDLELGKRSSATKIIASLRELGFVMRHQAKHEPIQLTTLGREFAALALRDQALFAELIHCRFFQLWTPEQHGAGFAWAYQWVTQYLWREAPTLIIADSLVSHIIEQAELHFGTQSISFSSSSILGIMHWLKALRPVCIDGRMFRRRELCTPEACYWMLETICTAKRHPFGIPFRLDASVKQRLCQSLVLEPSMLDEVLDLTSTTLDLPWRHGLGGETVMLHKPLFNDKNISEVSV